MTAETVRSAVIACGGLGLTIFVVQCLSWFLFRFQRISRQVWRVVAKSAQRVGITLLLVGMACWFFARPEGDALAMVTLIGGLLNTSISTLHLWVVEVMERMSTEQRRPRPPRDRK